jgi:anaerobic ribonucleoside-triphosphate reductase activating protein
MAARQLTSKPSASDPWALRLHQFLPFSRANGPGARAVLWVQGCSLGCPGCFNPQTHPWAGGEVVLVDDLLARLAALGGIEGITVSGGEPLQQRPALLALLRRVRKETALSVLLFTGYRWEEVRAMPQAEALLACVDVLLAGRYDARQHLARDLRGSANKTVHFLTGRYTPADLQAVPAAEVIISPDGEVQLSGIDPVRWQEDPSPRVATRGLFEEGHVP